MFDKWEWFSIIIMILVLICSFFVLICFCVSQKMLSRICTYRGHSLQRWTCQNNNHEGEIFQQYDFYFWLLPLAWCIYLHKTIPRASFDKCGFVFFVPYTYNIYSMYITLKYLLDCCIYFAYMSNICSFWVRVHIIVLNSLEMILDCRQKD